MRPSDLTQEGMVLQVGVAPVRVDVITCIPGPKFEDAWKRRVTVPFGEEETYFISKEDLIAVKLASGRKQDLRDVRRLRRPKRTPDKP